RGGERPALVLVGAAHGHVSGTYPARAARADDGCVTTRASLRRGSHRSPRWCRARTCFRAPTVRSSYLPFSGKRLAISRATQAARRRWKEAGPTLPSITRR